jgi:hypothetical protein
MLGEWLSRFRFFVTGKKRIDVDEELQFHLDRAIEANLAAGMSATEAQRQAGIAFGSRERAREECREQLPRWLLESLLRDLRYGLRGLGRNPGFATVAVLTLALGIGANTTIFSLLDQALMRTLPVQDPGQLVVLSFAGSDPGHHHSEGGDTPGRTHEFSYLMYRDLRDKNTVFHGLIAFAPKSVGITWNNHAESVSAEMVSGNYFQTLGVRPALGRLLVAGDETSGRRQCRRSSQLRLLEEPPGGSAGGGQDPAGEWHALYHRWRRSPRISQRGLGTTRQPCIRSDYHAARESSRSGRCSKTASPIGSAWWAVSPPGVTPAQASASLNALFLCPARNRVPAAA